jgi:VanZ family protein
MSYLILRALQLDFDNGRAYAFSLALTTIVGLGDETVQWALPQRYFELKDVGLNAISALLALLLTRFAWDYQKTARS